MKSKAILGMILTVLALAFVVNTVSAAGLGCEDYMCLEDVIVNDLQLSEFGQMGAQLGLRVSEDVEVEVIFTPTRDIQDARVKLYVDDGLSEEIYLTSDREDYTGGVTYKETFHFTLPSSTDLDDLKNELDIELDFSAKDEAPIAPWYFTLQVDRYGENLHILSIDAPTSASAGSTIAVDVVVENDGQQRLENVYIKASIPELGIQKKVYAGDLESLDEIEESQNCGGQPCSLWNDLDEDDTVVKRVYLTLPSNTQAGSYELEVEAYNVDVAVVAKERIVVEAVNTGVISPTGAKTIAQGEETTFSIVLVNPSEAIAVYTITPVETPGLIVEVVEPTVVVGAEDSKTVLVNVRATSSADEGTRVVTLNVNDENGLVATKQLTVNVDEKTTTSVARNDAVFILTVVLVIVFVVLLIILLVLLTKKPAEAEEFGETSYY